MKSFRHIQQITESYKFQMFDYGSNNIKIYNTSQPPEYNLSLIDVPITLMGANHDSRIPSCVREFFVF